MLRCITSSCTPAISNSCFFLASNVSKAAVKPVNFAFRSLYSNNSFKQSYTKMYEEDHVKCGLLFTYICTLYRRLKNNNREHAATQRRPKRARISRSSSDRPSRYNNNNNRPGYFEAVFRPLKARDGDEFFTNTRMTASLFDSLVSLVGNDLWRALLPYRISVKERLAITLLYLAQGMSKQKIAQIYKLSSVQLVNDIILRTCNVLWTVLQPIYVVEPSALEYKSIAKNFNAKWQVPNCVGAIDSKLIVLTNSAQKADSQWQNLVMMATCDHCYVFTSISFGNRVEFRSASLGEALMDDMLSLPEIDVSAGDKLQVPYYFAGDLSLPLRHNLMRPYAGLAQNRRREIFNYRLSRAHQVIDNAFGILTARWQVFKKPINATAEDGEKIVLAAIALHNFIIQQDKTRVYCPENYADWEDEDHIIRGGGWRSDAKGIGTALAYAQCGIRNASKSDIKQREDLAKYFENEGAVSFQDVAINRLQDA